ncbi:Negative regulator of mitotic exit [Podila minutissima]|uniref:Negative regulator of mitotic exit n=1 Tax=Podila minutissima TaxID=64525 RepID=A0A9P5SD72_9FUNG|nr:Negative regulator of mitotic exit [Podila minutissima]
MGMSPSTSINSQNSFQNPPNHGYNNVNNAGHINNDIHGPRSPMSPGFPHNNNAGMPMSPMSNNSNSGPPSPLQAQFAAPPGSSNNMLATPQLFWTQRRILGTNPFPRFMHTSSITATGTDIYLYGGNQRGTPTGDLFIVDSVSLQCQPVVPAGQDHPMPKSGHSAVNIGQYIIYFGGWDSVTGQCDDSLHVLHTARKEWNKPPIQGPLPTPRHSHTACAVGTTMFVFGGQVDSYYLDDISSFDMKSITQNPHWEKIEPQTESPPARSGHCAGVHEGKIYIFGGADADYFYNDIWCFDPRGATWTPIPASGYLPTGRNGHSCTVADGTMYIFGGNSPDGVEMNDAYAFKIHERRWYLFQNVGPVASPRSGHTMCTIKDRIFVLGGESEQTKSEDSALIFYLEISKIRYPDSGSQPIPPRQASTNMASNRPNDGHILPDSSSSASNSDRTSGQIQPQRPGQGPPQGPHRPDRPDRRHTERPGSPATFATIDRQVSGNNINISQQTSQLINPQLGNRPLTTLGTPPPRGASSSFQNQGPGGNDFQPDGLSIATRRQTMKDDFQGGYGGAVMGSGNNSGMNANIGGPNGQRRTMHQIPSPPPSAGPHSSPLRVINVTTSSPPLADRSLPGSGEISPITSRPDMRRNDFEPPGSLDEEDMNPYAMEAIVTPATSGPPSSSYIPPPPPSVSPAISAIAAPSNPPPLVPPLSAALPTPPTGCTLSPPSESKGHVLPPLPHGPSTPLQTQAPLLPSPIGSSTPIPGPLDRSASPATFPGGYNRAPPPPPPGSSHPHQGSFTAAPPSQPAPISDFSLRSSPSDTAKIKTLESRAEAALDENQQLRQEVKEREQELQMLKKRENWLVTEVMLARSGSTSTSTSSRERNGLGMDNSDMDIERLEQELGAADFRQNADGSQIKITKALIKVREELKNAKVSIATQAHAASLKIKEAERIRTGALQEAAYLKAKLSSLTQQDPDALARVEMDRALDLEKRLTSALQELEILETHHAQTLDALEQERHARLEAEERSTASATLAQEAQAAHTRAHTELSSLHARVTKSEAESREYQAQLAETQAGFSGHQSQSSGLLQKVTSLKQQVEQQQTALERTQKAYSIANDRATRAETLADEVSKKLERLEGERLDLSSQVNRFRGESERFQSKAEELEGRYKVSNDEVQTLRKLVEEGMASLTIRAGPGSKPQNKHDSIAILSTVSRVSELEHELNSLKMLHTQSQSSASKSANDLADAMIELSRLEQSSIQARSEVLALQKLLSHEREGSAQLRNTLTKTEQDLEEKAKELEDHEVQLGLLKDVMREKGLLAEDMVEQARFRGSGDYVVQLEERIMEAERRTQAQEQELEETREHFTQQLEGIEAKRQATIQHAEKTGHLLRKIKNNLEATMKEKIVVETELKTLHEAHSRCANYAHELVALRESQKDQDDERVEMLQEHWDEERKELSGQVNELQNRLMDSEMHAAELSQKIISLTARIEEIENLNEAISDELETTQDEFAKVQSNAQRQEKQLQADIEKLVQEIHQVQKGTQAKQRDLDRAMDLNEQLEQQLSHALEAQAAAVTAASSKSESHSSNLGQLEHQRKDLEQRLKKAQETIAALEGNNSALEARLSDSEKKVTLLLEDMQNNFSNSNSPLNSANLAGVHLQLTNVAGARSAGSRTSAVSVASIASAVTGNATMASRTVSNTKMTSSASPLTAGSHDSNSPVGQFSIATAAPSGLQINKNSTNAYSYGNNSVSPAYGYDIEDDSSSDDRDENEEAYRQYHQQRFGAHQQSQVSAPMHASSRDSVDSITRELEMLKVPWNKTNLGGVSLNANKKSPSPSQQHQQPYQYSNNFYHIGGEDQNDTIHSYSYTNTNQPHLYNDDSDNDDNIHGHHYHQHHHLQEEHQGEEEEGYEDDFLSRLRRTSSPAKVTTASGTSSSNKTTAVATKDTHSFNDRSPSRLREYEQLIDEMEKSRIR